MGLDCGASLNFTRQQIADACLAYGPQLTELPYGVDGAQLLWALSGNESSFGANCTPRYEPAYDVGGRYADADLLARFGRAAACSYGEVMLDQRLPLTIREIVLLCTPRLSAIC